MKHNQKREKRPAIDLGTPELRAKRIAAAGIRPAGWPTPDLAYTTTPLGQLLIHGALARSWEASKRLYDAGMAFAGWWVLVHPKSFPTGTLGALQPGIGTDVDTEEAQRLLRAAEQLLGRKRQTLDAVINTCVYQRYNPLTVRHLLRGLEALVEWNRNRAVVDGAVRFAQRVEVLNV